MTRLHSPTHFPLIPENVAHSWCCSYATVGHINMRIFNFVILSVITAPHNVPTPHINKTHLPIVLLNVRELELN